MTEIPFEISWCYEPGDYEGNTCSVLPIVDDPNIVTPLHIKVKNLLDEVITIQSITEGVASSENYHFQLDFNPDILNAPDNIAVGDGSQWSVHHESDNLYLLLIGSESITINPDASTDIILTRVAAAKEAGSDNTEVTISWDLDENIAFPRSTVPPQLPYETETTLELEMIKVSAATNIPLYVGFVGSNKVLNTTTGEGESSSLTLRITNTSFKETITFSNSQFTAQLFVTLEVEDNSLDRFSVPWALGTTEQLEDISITLSVPAWVDTPTKLHSGEYVRALTWTIIPQIRGVVELAPQESLTIKLEDIKTLHPTGETNLYLGYQDIDGYANGQFTCQIEKAPLTIDTVLHLGKQNTKIVGDTNANAVQISTIQAEAECDTQEILRLQRPKKEGLVNPNTASFKIGKCEEGGRGATQLDIALSSNEMESNDWGNDADQVVMSLFARKFSDNDARSDTTLEVCGRIKDKTGYVMPVGTIVAYAGSTAPIGWWICDGGFLNKSNYPELFDAIGYTYGSNGDTFQLPNLQGRVPVGKKDGDFAELGQTGGERKHTLTVAEMPSHSHGVSDPGHYHTLDVYKHNGSAGSLRRDEGKEKINVGIENSFTNIEIDPNGGGAAHNNLQPYLVINYIIKA